MGMARLIDADALGIGLCNPDAFPVQNRGYCAGWNGVIRLIEDAPTIDAVPVVRCKDCRYWGGVTYGYVCSRWSAPLAGFKTCTKPEGFCADGERRRVE